MSISSSSSATTCGYKDFLIDDDYIDQQQLTFTKDQNVLSIDETIKEKMDLFLSTNDTKAERIKFDDEKSMRETLVKKDVADDSSSLGTLSEQESIDIDIESSEEKDNDNSVYVDLNHNDITEDVMEMKAMLYKLKAVLNNNFNEDGVKQGPNEAQVKVQIKNLKKLIDQV